MIGDTIATADRSSGTGDLPDATSHITTFTKVNNDNYGSEYRFRGTLYDYVLKLRNSTESPQKTGLVYTRHNAELQVILRGNPAASPPVADVPFVCNITARLPKGGDKTVLIALAGHLGQLFCSTSFSSQYMLQRLINFES